jgi:hypoxanthine phosphoribosyltransferase
LTDIKYLFLNWDDVICLAEKVADKIIESGFEPDIVIAISRGGFDHSRILCDELDLRDLTSFQMVYYSNINERKDVPRITMPLSADIKGLKVLLVDDVSDSGNSLEYAKKYVESFNPSEIRLASLHLKPWSSFKSDFNAEIVDDWILYPWERRESIVQIYEKLRSKGFDNKIVAKKLKSIGFNDHHLERYLGISK